VTGAHTTDPAGGQFGSGAAPSHRWQPVKFDFRFQPSPKYLMNAKLSPKTNKRRPHNKWMGSYTKYNQVMFHAWLKRKRCELIQIWVKIDKYAKRAAINHTHEGLRKPDPKREFQWHV